MGVVSHPATSPQVKFLPFKSASASSGLLTSKLEWLM